MYKLKFAFADTEEEAKQKTAEINANYSRYMRKHHPASYTPWSNESGTERAFVVWFYV